MKMERGDCRVVPAWRGRERGSEGDGEKATDEENEDDKKPAAADKADANTTGGRPRKAIHEGRAG